MSDASIIGAHFTFFRLAQARGKGYAYFRFAGASASFGVYPCTTS